MTSMSAQDIYEVINVSTGLNVRNTPTSQGKIIGSLKNGELITVNAISNGWAEILYKDKNAYVSSRYIRFKEHINSDTIPQNNDIITDFTYNDTLFVETNVDVNTKSWLENWGIDFTPSLYIGASNFIGDYTPIAHFGWGVDMAVQFYQKQNNLPLGWMAEASIGYAMKGGGGMPVHYFDILILPAGYAYTFKQEVTLYALCGLSINLGGGSLSAYYSNSYKTYYANLFDVGMQLKIATEWHKFGFAISYDQGFLNVIDNSRLALKNFGFNFHFIYRLWDIPNNTIYKPLV